MNAIEIRNLTKVYQDRGEKVVANDGINLDIQIGEIVGFLGPNGAGKTTLIKQIVGQLKPTSGDIKLMDIDVKKYPRRIQRYLGYMPQFGYTHFSHLTVEEAIYYTAILRGIDNNNLVKEMNLLIERMVLTKEQKRLLGKLSGGKQQAVRLCLALIGKPEIVILDEPTSGLDPEMRIIFWNVVRENYEQKKKTILWVTHNVQEAETMCQRVVIIRNGKILTMGRPLELKEKVYGSLRLEITFKTEALVPKDFFNEALWVKEHKYIIFLSHKDISKKLVELLNQLSFDQNVEDIKISQVSLEDVYIQLAKERLE